MQSDLHDDTLTSALLAFHAALDQLEGVGDANEMQRSRERCAWLLGPRNQQAALGFLKERVGVQSPDWIVDHLLQVIGPETPMHAAFAELQQTIDTDCRRFPLVWAAKVTQRGSKVP